MLILFTFYLEIPGSAEAKSALLRYKSGKKFVEAVVPLAALLGSLG